MRNETFILSARIYIQTQNNFPWKLLCIFIVIFLFLCCFSVALFHVALHDWGKTVYIKTSCFLSFLPYNKTQWFFLQQYTRVEREKNQEKKTTTTIVEIFVSFCKFRVAVVVMLTHMRHTQALLHRFLLMFHNRNIVIIIMQHLQCYAAHTLNSQSQLITNKQRVTETLSWRAQTKGGMTEEEEEKKIK
jgi:hypothetical protein